MAEALILEREIYIVLSTAHLSRSTAQTLFERADICDATVSRYRIPFACALTAEPAPGDDLLAVLTTIAAAAPDAYGVMIDSDGPVVPGLSTFDW
jgi:hypothetical protein